MIVIIISLVLCIIVICVIKYVSRKSKSKELEDKFKLYKDWVMAIHYIDGKAYAIVCFINERCESGNLVKVNCPGHPEVTMITWIWQKNNFYTQDAINNLLDPEIAEAVSQG